MKIKTESSWKCDICGGTEVGGDVRKPSGWSTYSISNDLAGATPPKVIVFDACKHCAPSHHEKPLWAGRMKSIVSALFKGEKAPAPQALIEDKKSPQK